MRSLLGVLDLLDGAGPGVAHTRTLTLVSSRFSRKTGRAGGIWPSRKWNHCNTTVTLGNRNCLGEQKVDKNRIRFRSPIANQKQSHGPQTGAALRPPKCNERRPPSLLSGTPGTGLGQHRRRSQDIQGGQRAEGQVSTLSKSNDCGGCLRLRGLPPRGNAARNTKQIGETQGCQRPMEALDVACKEKGSQLATSGSPILQGGVDITIYLYIQVGACGTPFSVYKGNPKKRKAR